MTVPGNPRSLEIEAWLDAGGVVVAASERAARALRAQYSQARLAAGLRGWPTPAIFSWETWLREAWIDRNSKGLLLLNADQERALWQQVLEAAKPDLRPTHRLAMQAQKAWQLLADYAPEAVGQLDQLGWVGEFAEFAQWLGDFLARCRRDNLLSAALLAAALAEIVAEEATANRPALLLVGFDRLLPVQEQLLAAWGAWQHEAQAGPAVETAVLACVSEEEELAACVRWLRERLAANAKARLLVVAPNIADRRGALERALLETPAGMEPIRFEFSLGKPLEQVGLVHSALLLLGWLTPPDRRNSQAPTVTEVELDWLAGAGDFARDAEEVAEMTAAMLRQRDLGQQRAEWTLAAFVAAGGAAAEHGWAARLKAAEQALGEKPAYASPMEWVAVAAELLTLLGWPGYRPLSSTAYQARKLWERLLDTAASLGFQGAAMSWQGFVSALKEIAAETIFATESREPQVLLSGPAESAGLQAEGIWFLGAVETDWPIRGAANPLLPIGWQKQHGLPHASAQLDWELAHQTTLRLLASAPVVVFSHARSVADGDTRPSRMVERLSGKAAVAAPPEPERQNDDAAEWMEDATTVPFPLRTLRDGVRTLTRQSQCPFQAFAVARLGAGDWQAAEAGLDARQRGTLMHAALGRIWGGPEKGGLKSLTELRALSEASDLTGFVRTHVDAALRDRTSATLRETLPPALLMLEADRLTTLLTSWLGYELKRAEFTVFDTEFKRSLTIAGLTMQVRLDRVDLVGEDGAGGALILDYKSGSLKASAWLGERPDDVQLPLYAAYAPLSQETGYEDAAVAGILIATTKPGKDMGFSGRVRDAQAMLNPGLHASSGLAKNPLDDAQLEEWRRILDRLAGEFLEGRAEVDPKDDAKTCQKCHLQAVCRVYENLGAAAMSADEGGEDGEGEADA